MSIYPHWHKMYTCEGRGEKITNRKWQQWREFVFCLFVFTQTFLQLFWCVWYKDENLHTFCTNWKIVGSIVSLPLSSSVGCTVLGCFYSLFSQTFSQVLCIIQCSAVPGNNILQVTSSHSEFFFLLMHIIVSCEFDFSQFLSVPAAQWPPGIYKHSWCFSCQYIPKRKLLYTNSSSSFTKCFLM